MRRRLFLAALASRLGADTRQELVDMFGGMAAALSQGNPSAFLRAIDPSLADYAQFAANVQALATQNDLSSSIEITSQNGNDDVQVVELDWLLQIRGKDQSQLFERRQSVVKSRLERRKKQWRIVALDPLTFFSPPTVKQ